MIDEDSSITDVSVNGNTKSVTIMKNLKHDMSCPLCGHKLNSKGQFKRHPNNQILNDGYKLDVTAIGRRWKCSNPECSYSCYDQFNFIEKRKRVTKIVDFQIIMTMKDIKLSCTQIAKMYSVSDTYVYQLFLRHVDLSRLKLTKFICIDEVYLNISPTCKYALVIMDFITGEVLDIIESRRKEYTQRYFLSIPREERAIVEYICCDMYDSYINYTSSYFPNAKAITDSFHVLQWLLRLINNYINEVKKRYQALDRKRLENKNHDHNLDNQTIKESDEVYILKQAKWVLLLNPKNWYYYEPRFNHRLNRIMDTYRWERCFLELDDKFKSIRDLKDLYEDFNNSFINDLDGATKRLDELIDIYSHSDIKIFRDFSNLLIKYRESIVNSFVYVSSSSDPSLLRRLSNGPLESFNNIPSALRTSSHGIDNFRFTRNRILWHLRDDAPILGYPKTASEVHTIGKKRGKYKK